jgi:hypothetical protein
LEREKAKVVLARAAAYVMAGGATERKLPSSDDVESQIY